MIKLIVGLFAFGIFTVDAVVLGGADKTSSFKKYTHQNDNTLYCKTRDLEDACPLDYEIQSCRENFTQVICHPCDTMAGYRTCVQVYSAIDLVKCYRPAILCKPEELLVLHTLPDGACYKTSCVKDCGTIEGFVQKGSQCVPQCEVNTTLSNGTCKPCLKGTYRPETSEKCTIIPESNQQEWPSTESTQLNKTDPSDKQTKVTGGDTNDGGDTSPDLSTTESVIKELTIILAVTIPCAAVIVFVIVLVCFLCHKDRPTDRERAPGFCCLCCLCYNTIKSEGHAPVNGSAIRPVSPVVADLERAERAPEDSLTAEETVGTLPPTYMTEDCTYPPPASGGIPPHDNPEIPEGRGKPKEERPASPLAIGDIDTTDEERAPLISGPSSESTPRFPTLITKEGSSLLPQNQSDREAVHTVPDLQPAGAEVSPPSHSEAVSAFTEDQRDGKEKSPQHQNGIGLVELSEELDANTLDNYTFGSHLRVSSITDISNSV